MPGCLNRYQIHRKFQANRRGSNRTSPNLEACLEGGRPGRNFYSLRIPDACPPIHEHPPHVLGFFHGLLLKKHKEPRETELHNPVLPWLPFERPGYIES